MSEERYTKADVEALLDIAVKAREHLQPDCSHPPEWRTRGICGICLRVADKREAGIYNKFYVERTDGQSAPGAKHDGCDYFVLDLTHDEFAPEALAAYAAECRTKYPQLSTDLYNKLIRGSDGRWYKVGAPDAPG